MVVFLILISLFLSSCSTSSIPSKEGVLETKISGIISKDKTLRGKVIIEKDLLIKRGVTVKIAEGTEILVEKSDISRTEPIFLMPETEIVVEGSLIINGTEEKPVKFTSLDRSDPYWGGIIIKGGEVRAENIQINNSYTAITLLAGKLSLKKGAINHNKIGIFLQGGEASITDSHLSSNETAIINNLTNTFFKDILLEKNGEGFLMKACPDKILNLKVRDNIYGIITNSSCLNFNLINTKSYENKNNIIIADFTD